MVVDSRAIGAGYRWEYECTIEGQTLTATRTDWDGGWGMLEIYFRIYDPADEEVPAFNNETYTYLGLENEQAPKDVEEVVVDPSVKVIRMNAFYECKMKKCIMGDNVEGIE